jgi:hypothetical protein
MLLPKTGFGANNCRVRRRRIWDVEELDLAFKALPREGGEGEAIFADQRKVDRRFVLVEATPEHAPTDVFEGMTSSLNAWFNVLIASVGIAISTIPPGDHSEAFLRRLTIRRCEGRTRSGRSQIRDSRARLWNGSRVVKNVRSSLTSSPPHLAAHARTERDRCPGAARGVAL